jgi:hypothetical protein
LLLPKGWITACSVIAGLVGWTTVTASVPIINRVDSHRLERDSEAWYPVGYYPAIGTLVLDRTDPGYVTTFIDKLFDNKLNYFRNVFTMGQQIGDSSIPYLRTGPDNAADGRPKYDLEQFNQAHFDRWLDIVSHAGTRDVVVQIPIFDLWHNKTWITSPHDDVTREWGLKYDFYQGANNINGVDVTTPAEWVDPAHPVFDIQKALIEKTIDTLGALPNIIWEVGNEAPDSRDADGSRWQQLLAEHITNYELSIGVTPHLVIPRDLPNHENTPGHQYDSPAVIHNELVARFQQAVPLISDNDCCTVDPPDSAYQRAKAWASLTAGAHLSFFNFPMRDMSVLESPEVAQAMAYLGNVSRFITDLDVELEGMAPCDELVGEGWCYGRARDEYIVYLPAGGNTSLEVLPGNVTATWFDPRDATTSPATVSGCSEFTGPDSRDWTLHLVYYPVTAEPDADGDGISDSTETRCLGTSADDVDSDGDGLVDGFDGVIPVGSLAVAVDLNGDGYADGEQTLGTNAANSDTDGDGVLDNKDNCPLIAYAGEVDANGIGYLCSTGPIDSAGDADADGVVADIDNCPLDANPDQEDADKDGIGDVCDTCVLDPDNDIDADGVCGNVDNCPNVANPYQSDIDADGYGDACDVRRDNPVEQPAPTVLNNSSNNPVDLSGDGRTR